MNDGLIPAPVLVALKRAMPNATDEMIAGAWQQATTANPSLKQTDPMTSAQRIATAFGSAQRQSPAAAPAPATVSPVAAPSAVPVAQMDPFQGATSAAELQREFNPELIRSKYDKARQDYEQAYKKQAEEYQARLPSRQAASYFLAQGSLGGQAVRDLQKDADAQTMLQTITQAEKLYGLTKDEQEKLFKTATDGLAAGKTAQEIQSGAQKLFKEFVGSAAAGLDLQKLQRYNTADSVETQSAKMALAKVASTNVFTPQDRAQLQQLMNRPGVTAAMLSDLLSKYVPEMYKAYTDAAGIAKTGEEAGLTRAQAAAQAQTTGIIGRELNLPPPGPTAVGPTAGQPQPAAAPMTAPTQGAATGAPPTFNFAPGTDLQAARAVLSRQPEAATILPAFDAQFPDVVTGRQQYYGTRETTLPAPRMAGEQSSAESQRLAGKPLVGRPSVPVGPPVMAAINAARPQPTNFTPEYIANAEPAQLSEVQKLEQERLGSTDVTRLRELDRQIATAKGEQYPVRAPRVLGDISQGGTTLTRGPLYQGNVQSTARDIQETSQQVSGYQQGGREAALYAASNAQFGGPAFENVIATGNPKAQQFQISINRLNDMAADLGLIKGTAPSTGAAAAVGGLGAGVAALPGAISKIAGPTLAAGAGLLSNTQQITTTSDPAVIQDFAYKVQLAAARKQALLAKQQAWADRHEGDGSGFVNSPEFKHVMNSKPLVDPTTGELVLPLTATQRRSFMSDKNKEFVPLDRLVKAK